MAALLRCPECGKVLATCGNTGAIKPRTSILIERGEITLVCPCGGKLPVEAVVPYLLPTV
jgi:hypothetical protein